MIAPSLDDPKHQPVEGQVLLERLIGIAAHIAGGCAHPGHPVNHRLTAQDRDPHLARSGASPRGDQSGLIAGTQGGEHAGAVDGNPKIGCWAGHLRILAAIQSRGLSIASIRPEERLLAHWLPQDPARPWIPTPGCQRLPEPVAFLELRRRSP
jgi:hypothetical protein